MKSFAQKKEELTKLKDKLAKAKIVIFSSFAREGEKGLNVAEMRELKTGLRVVKGDYVIGKKTLLNRALNKEANVFDYSGSVGLVFGYEEGQSVAKSFYGFAKKHPALKYFGAVWNGKFMDLAQFTEFAKLPAKDIMIARLLGMMRYPLQALAITLKQIADKQNLEARK